ncbi:Yip1 domain-containing protein [Hyaloraphidium curvatum]|nr:Yip1 domain-containing protein [Hyaloraphidium curvatum]
MAGYGSMPGDSAPLIQPLATSSPLRPDDLSLSTGSHAAIGVSGSMNDPSTSRVVRSDLDTLDEPVSTTIMRDLTNVWNKMRQVLWPTKERSNILRDWDLWGPLLLCLTLAIRLGVTAPEDQSALVFTSIFVIVWCGAAVVTLNSQLLGGRISFFQSVCVLGYCIFPLVIASLFSLFLPSIIIRGVIVGIAFFWAAYASVGFLGDVRLEKRRALAVYPMVLFYFGLGWLVLISQSMFG